MEKTEVIQKIVEAAAVANEIKRRIGGESNQDYVMGYEKSATNGYDYRNPGVPYEKRAGFGTWNSGEGTNEVSERAKEAGERMAKMFNK